MTAICALCGKPESAHHPFTPIELPPGCVCDPREWVKEEMKPICDRYMRPRYGIITGSVVRVRAGEPKNQGVVRKRSPFCFSGAQEGAHH